MAVPRTRKAAAATALVLVVAITTGMKQESTVLEDENRARADSSRIKAIEDLVLYPKGTVGFREDDIGDTTLTSILGAITPYVSLCPWRLIAIHERAHRIALLESMQAAYRAMDKPRWAATMDRWKRAPVILVFCMPDETGDFAGVPSETMRPMALIELGVGVQSLILTARAHGIETHWIASALLVQDVIKRRLNVPDGYTVVFFGVAGYPEEEIDQQFVDLGEVCFAESWEVPFAP